MAKVQCEVVNVKGEKVGSVDLDPGVFASKPHPGLVHETVRWQRARRRAGTHSTLIRKVMEGGAKKPWRQKGTGRARAGSSISPLWVGGAVVFGPTPRDYDYRLPKRTRRQALVSALSDKHAQGKLIVIDALELKQKKTQEVQKVLDKLGVESARALLVFSNEERDKDGWRCSRNLATVTPMVAAGVNVYDVLKSAYIVATKEGLSALQTRLRAEKGEK